MAKKKEQVAKKTAKLDDKQLDKVQGGVVMAVRAKAKIGAWQYTQAKVAK